MNKRLERGVGEGAAGELTLLGRVTGARMQAIAVQKGRQQRGTQGGAAAPSRRGEEQEGAACRKEAGGMHGPERHGASRG